MHTPSRTRTHTLISWYSLSVEAPAAWMPWYSFSVVAPPHDLLLALQCAHAYCKTPPEASDMPATREHNNQTLQGMRA